MRTCSQISSNGGKRLSLRFTRRTRCNVRQDPFAASRVRLLLERAAWRRGTSEPVRTNRYVHRYSRVGFLKAALLWGSATLLITEALSVFTTIRPTTLALAWILVIASALYVIRRHIVQEGINPLVVARRLFALPAGERWWIENDHRRGRNHQRRHTLGKASTAQDSDKQGDTYHGSYKCEPLHQIRETAASINIPSVAIPSNGDRSRHSCAND